MPGTVDPQGGLQGFWAHIQGLEERLRSLEAWQRTVVSIPPGTITGWPTGTPPAGALLCNGATFSAGTYPALFAVLGSSTLPNLTGPPTYIIWTD